MNKDDRNTAIIVAVVLVISTISLVVLGGYVLKIVTPMVSTVLSYFGDYVRPRAIDYNFAVPKRPYSGAAPYYLVPTNYTFNFSVPRRAYTNSPSNVTGIGDKTLVRDAEAAGYGSQTISTQIAAYISIPLLNLYSPIYGSNIGDELFRGFWSYPTGSSIRNTEIYLCQRQYFGIGDPRSCLNLDKLKIGDEVFVYQAGESLRYVVTATNLLQGQTIYTYRGSAQSGQIQIITSDPAGSGENRIQIIAQRKDL